MSDQPKIKSERELSRDRVLAAIAAMTEAMSGLSSKECRDALAMVSAPRNLRVIPMDRPIGNPDGKPKVETHDGGSSQSKKNPSKAAWKVSKEWKEAIASRKAIVDDLKAIDQGDSPDQTALAQKKRELSNFEEQMRSLKQSLRGFGN